MTIAQNNTDPSNNWTKTTTDPIGGGTNPFDPENNEYGQTLPPPGNFPTVPFYNKWNGRNFPADAKFSKVADNLRLTSSTNIKTGPQQGPRSSLTFYAYNIPDWRNDKNEPIEATKFPKSGLKVEYQTVLWDMLQNGAPYNSVQTILIHILIQLEEQVLY